MKTVQLYTMVNCPYCTQAKALLKRRGVAFEEHLVPLSDDAQWASLYKRSGMRTMPQIFNGDDLVGGYSDLAELDRKDELASLK
jgi:glutaredoxin 3